MSYIPEEKIYLHVIKESETPIFPIPAEKVDVYKASIGEGLVQVLGVPKELGVKANNVKIRSLELAKKIKVRGFVIVVSKYNNQTLLSLIKNRAIWLTKIIPDFEKDEMIKQVKDYVATNYQQEVGKVLVETEMEKKQLSLFPEFQGNKLLVISLFTVMLIVIALLVIFYL